MPLRRVRYRLALEALPSSYACHCHQCQRWSGSAFSQQIVLPEAAITVSGPVAIYERTTDDRTSTQRLCGVCHARIYNTNTRRPGLAVARAGTLDRSEEVACVAHIFTAYRQHWFVIPDSAAQWPEAPPLAELTAVLAGATSSSR